MIRKLKGKNKYRLYSLKSHINMGTFTSRAKAVKREKQILYFKHLKAS